MLTEEVKNELSEYGKKMAGEYRTTLETVIEKAKEELKMDGKASEDSRKLVETLTINIKELDEKFGKQFSELATKLNSTELGMFGNNEKRAKNLENLIFEQLKEAKDQGALEKKNQNGTKRFAVEDGHSALHRKAVGTFTSGNLTDGSAGEAFSARDIRTTVVAAPTPKVHVRNLLNTSTMTETYLEYPQFVGGEGAPNYQVNQGDLKAQIDYDFIMVPVRPKTLAAFSRVSLQALNDISWLANFFSTQMMIDLLKKEDAELLNGTGVNSIKGLIPSATDYVPTAGIDPTLFDYMVDAAAQLETLDYDANGFVLHPLDYAKLLTYKTTTGEFNYPGLVFGGEQRNLLVFNGVPIYKMSQIAQGKALLGDWTRAELLIRKGINFGLFYEDADNVQRNLVTLRIEEELALAVYHPQAFLDMDITAVTGGV